jgi:hypothetical protein
VRVGVFATVGGGGDNVARAAWSTVGGGFGNQATRNYSVVAGGYSNGATGHISAVLGGFNNTASGDYSFAMGFQSEARGDYSVALGRRAKTYIGVNAAHGQFSFADSNDFDFESSTPNVFRARATGGVRFVTDIDAAGNTTWSCAAFAGAGWACASDRNQKQNLRRLDGKAVLEQLVAMPVFEWYPKGRNAHVRHYGPMAQDFKAAFDLGDDDTLIGSQDADGVALAAIQGLDAKLVDELRRRDALIDAQRGELDRQRDEIAELRRMLTALLADARSRHLARSPAP